VKIVAFAALLSFSALAAETQDKKKPAGGPVPPPLNQPGNIHPGPIPPITPPTIPAKSAEGERSRPGEKKPAKKNQETPPSKQK